MDENTDPPPKVAGKQKEEPIDRFFFIILLHAAVFNSHPTKAALPHYPGRLATLYLY